MLVTSWGLHDCDHDLEIKQTVRLNVVSGKLEPYSILRCRKCGRQIEVFNSELHHAQQIFNCL